MAFCLGLLGLGLNGTIVVFGIIMMFRGYYDVEVKMHSSGFMGLLCFLLHGFYGC